MNPWILRVSSILEYYGLRERTEVIPGYLHPNEGYVLYALAAEGDGAGAIVELGSLFGKSTCWLAAGSKSTHREKVTAIDLFSFMPEDNSRETAMGGAVGEIPPGTSEKEAIETHAQVTDPANRGRSLHLFEDFIRLMGLDDHVEPVVASSEEAARGWDGSIRLLFVDADHAYEAVKRDVELWSPHVVTGGYMAFHDVGEWPGVTRFYAEFAAADNGFQEVLQVAHIAVVQKQ